MAIFTAKCVEISSQLGGFNLTAGEGLSSFPVLKLSLVLSYLCQLSLCLPDRLAESCGLLNSSEAFCNLSSGVVC